MERPSAPGLKSLRTAHVLEEGMCITVEPGIYFIEPVSHRMEALKSLALLRSLVMLVSVCVLFSNWRQCWLIQTSPALSIKVCWIDSEDLAG